jgi:hypothetical protein
VQYASAATPGHPRDNLPASPYSSHDVDVQAALPSRFVVAHGKCRRVVDENIDTIQRLPGCFKEAAKGPRIANIAHFSAGPAALRDQLSFRIAQSVCSSRANCNVRSLLRETERDCAADALAGTSHHGTLATKT